MPVEERSRDVAIIGMACRFPGAPDLDRFWENLSEGRESITDLSEEALALAGVPASELQNPRYVRRAPLLDQYDRFDAGFFEYSPREARLMDPQHRVFLELAWETFENAGYDPLGPKGVVGVFAGSGGLVTSQLARVDHPDLKGQTGDIGHIGNDRDFLCSRVSFKLDLTGPSVNVQTACSTSLVAVHMACQSLVEGETDMALAGASVIRLPHVRGYLAEAGGIYAPDGRCRVFDERGAGTLFGSGVAAVLLKPLDRALADGDRIDAVIKGSAVTNDGAGKISYTASTAESQARAVVSALARADVSPETLSFMECHGTATFLGDPLEIQALKRAFRLYTKQTQFCPVGSVKSNLGHLEQCAGFAGLFKAVLALKHRALPPSLHFERPNPRIDFERSPFFVNTRLLPLGNGSTPLRAGVNSVGMGGTNAFVVLEEAPRVEKIEVRTARPLALCLSAPSESALQLQAQAYDRRLARTAARESVAAMCISAVREKHHFGHRLCAVGDDVTALRDDLATKSGTDHPRPARSPRRGPVFLFSGQGSQYPRMGEAVYRAEPVFREHVDDCLERFEAHGLELAPVLFSDEPGPINETVYAQPALFSIQMGLAALWAQWGVHPRVVIGHSVGEFAAAVVSGACTRSEAVRVVAARAKLMQSAREPGAMAAVNADPETVLRLLEACEPGLVLGALNAPRSTVVSGTLEAMEHFEALIAESKHNMIRLRASNAFHSPLMQEAADRFTREVSAARFVPPKLDWYSTLTGARIDSALDLQYWADQIVQPVRFADAIASLPDEPHTFIEIGPDSTLSANSRRTLMGRASAEESVWVPSLSRDDDTGLQTARSLGELYEHGEPVGWDGYFGTRTKRRDRPAAEPYRFERTRWALSAAPQERSVASAAPVSVPPRHPVLAGALGMGPGTYELVLSTSRLEYLSDHRVYGEPILPTTSALEAVVAAALDGGMRRPVVSDFVYQAPLPVPDDTPCVVQLTLEAAADHQTFRIDSTELRTGSEWQIHVSGTVMEGHAEPEALAPLGPGAELEAIPLATFYDSLAGRGLAYGPSFRGITSLEVGVGEALARVSCPDHLDPDAYLLHPAFLDASLHTYAAVADVWTEDTAEPGAIFVPISIERFALHRGGVTEGLVRTRLTSHSEERSTAMLDIDVLDPEGVLVAEFRGLTVARRTEAAFSGTRQVGPARYGVRWEPLATDLDEAALPAGWNWAVCMDSQGFGENVASHLEELTGRSVLRLRPGPADPDERGEHGLAVDTADGTSVADALAGLAGAPLGVIDLSSSDLGGRPEAESTGVGSLRLVQAMRAAAEGASEPSRLWIVTRGAQSAGMSVANPLQGVLWGLGRAVARELPGLGCTLIDLPADADEPSAGAALLIRSLSLPSAEDQIAWRDGQVVVPRLERRAPPDAAEATPVRPDATYWIVGGLGEIGLATAAALVERGARSLVLTGRSPSDRDDEGLDELRRSCEVTVLKSDVAVAGDVEAVLRRLEDAGLPPLKGVIHAAAVFEDAILQNTTVEQWRRVLSPKVAGAWHLHEATRDLDLDFFVVYSSVLSLWGASGQAAYGAANGFLDALVQYRVDRGLPAAGFNWGPWLIPGSEERWGRTSETLWKQRGTTRLPPESYLPILFEGSEGQVAVSDTRWPTLLANLTGVPSLFGDLAPASRVDRSRRAGARAGGTLGLLQELARATLGLDSPPDPTQPLGLLGLDSLLAVTLGTEINDAMGVTVPTAVLLRGPSLRELLDIVDPDGDHDEVEEPETEATASWATAGDGWAIFPRPNPEASVRLLCFPFAGGGATTFQDWVDHLDPSIELLCIEPPGHQTRIDEEPLRDVQAYAKQAASELIPFTDKPFAVYGHCLGALTMFETTSELVRRGHPPAHVFVSGARPPDQIHDVQQFETELLQSLLELPGFDVFEAVHDQPDDVFAVVMRQFNIQETDELLANDELRRILMPVVRADFAMGDGYRFRSRPAFDVPLTCMTGRHDVYVTEANARAWSRFTNNRFELLFFDTQHFLVVDEGKQVIDTINSRLRPRAPATSGAA